MSRLPRPPPSGVSPIVAAAAVALAAALLLPSLARGAELVAEAAFLPDTLPPGGRDLNLSFCTGSTSAELAPRAQLALAVSERVGFTTDVGVHRHEGRLALDTPSASLKLLLRRAAPGKTGLSTSLDLLGSAHSLADTEVGGGLGAVRPLGRVTLRAALWAASGISGFTPHAHLGLSGALAVGSRVRLLAEAVAELRARSQAVSAGPTVKVAVGEASSVMAGALVGLTPAAEPATVFVQLARGI